MDGKDVELFPFIPYILQDLWEIGSDPEIITALIQKHFSDTANIEVLDLGCGKGAVSVKLAKNLSCKCLGIDAIPEFISFAEKKAIEYGVEMLCMYKVGDMREMISSLPEFDAIILGSIGPVFGDYLATLTRLSKCLKRGGAVIIDDGYIDNGSKFTHPLMQKKHEIISQVNKAGMQLAEERIVDKNYIIDVEDRIFILLKSRCEELIVKHPEKSRLFEDYILKQKQEGEVLKKQVVCSTMLIKNW